MTNISTETKGPQGVQAYESLLPAAVSGYKRGLAVTYGTDSFHAALIAAAAVSIVGLIEEDAISTKAPVRVITFGQTVAQVSAAAFNAGTLLTVNATGQLVAAQAGQPVCAVALEPNAGVAGSYVTVFVLGLFGFTMPGDPVSYPTAAGAIPITPGEYTVAIDGAAALAMTLAQPTGAQDGTRIFVTAATAHAHTVTTGANGINGNKHVVTFAAVGDSVELEAVNLLWVVRSLVGAVLS